MCAVLALVLSLDGLGLRSMAARAATEEERAARFTEMLKSSMLALEDGDREAPRDRWDPKYVVDQVGVEPSRLFEWTRHAIRWVPYHGALRGPVGVLMDRTGNSLDQALLLGTLLRLAGKPVRLAHAALNPDAVGRAWQSLSSAPPPTAPLPPPPALPADSLDQVRDTAELYGIEQDAVATVLGTAVKDANALAARLGSRAEAQAARLVTALALPKGAAGTAGVDNAREALADHWWVQMQDGARWLDFDVLAPGGKPGEALAPATSNADLDALPESLEHHLTLRVVTEQWKGGVTREIVPVEEVLRVRDLIGVRISLMHLPMMWPADWPKVTPDDIQIKLRAALYTQSEWMPVLQVGDAMASKASVYTSGELNESPHPTDPWRALAVPMVGMMQKAADTLATIADPNAKLPGTTETPSETAPDPKGELSGEWLEFELAAPGAAPRKIRREVFDLIGPAARASGVKSMLRMGEARKLERSMALLGESELHVLPCRVAPEFLMHLAAQNATANRDLLDEMSSDPFSKLPPNYTEVMSKLTPLPGTLFTLSALRFAASPLAAGLYVDRPAIVAQHSVLSRGAGGDFAIGMALDIVENGVGVDPRIGGDAVRLRITQGVADTNAEVLAAEATGKVVTNTAEAFAAAAKSGEPWVTIHPGEEARVATLGLGADVAARMVADLKAGNVVVTPKSGAAAAGGAGWWRVDPVTGATLGVGPNGWGQAMVEYAVVVLVQSIISAAQCMVGRAMEAAAERALRKTAEASAKGTGLVKGVKEGLGAGKKEFEDVGKKEYKKADGFKCAAGGMVAGFNAFLMMSTMVALQTHQAMETAQELQNFRNQMREEMNAANKWSKEGPDRQPQPRPNPEPPPEPPPRSNKPSPPPEKPPSKPPPNEAPQEPAPPPPLKGGPPGERPIPQPRTPEEIAKAQAEREAAQQRRDKAIDDLDAAQDKLAGSRDPADLAARDEAKKAYDDANRESYYAQQRENIARAEKTAAETQQATDAARAKLKDHIDKGGDFKGPEYDQWQKALEASESAHQDFMDARYGKSPTVPSPPPAPPPPGTAPMGPPPGSPPPGAAAMSPPPGSPPPGQPIEPAAAKELAGMGGLVKAFGLVNGE